MANEAVIANFPSCASTVCNKMTLSLFVKCGGEMQDVKIENVNVKMQDVKM